LYAAAPLRIMTETDSLGLARRLVKEPGVIKMAWKREVAALLLCWLLGFPLALRASGGKQENPDAKVDYASARRDILRFEVAVNEAINSTFSASPFAVVQKAKGVYLEGYGVSFSFLVNIHRAVVTTPFGEIIRSRPGVTPDLKKRRIEELKEKLIGVIQDKGEILRELREEDYVTIVAFVEDRNFPDEPNVEKTIVLSARKKDLDELAHRNGRPKEFKQRIKIVEY
jgi:hypothetical protein